MEEFEFLLEDRIAKIRAINEQFDLEHNAYIAYSGGKDSTILHYLIDIALPNNNIPRVFANTGLEYSKLVKYVKKMALDDKRIIILNQTKNIKSTLSKYGYPFKSKEFSSRVCQFNNESNANYIRKYLDEKSVSKFKCPKMLRFIFNNKKKYNYSNLCCSKLKKDLQHKWAKENKKKVCITGMRNEEGGNRERLTCLTNHNKMFHPLIVCSEQWEENFVKEFSIKLCELYYPPYNFTRTGCKGCPYNLHLQKDLDTMDRLLPNEKKQCEIIWKPIYAEYRRLGYRLRKNGEGYQMNIFDF